MIQELSANEAFVLLSLLSGEKRSQIKQILDNLDSKGDIIDFKTSEPFSIIQFVEQTTVLKTLGYHLMNDIPSSHIECPCCRNKTSVSLIYAQADSLENTHDFVLCLNCFHAVKLTAIYASAEGEV